MVTYPVLWMAKPLPLISYMIHAYSINPLPSAASKNLRGQTYAHTNPLPLCPPPPLTSVSGGQRHRPCQSPERHDGRGVCAWKEELGLAWRTQRWYDYAASSLVGGTQAQWVQSPHYITDNQNHC